MECGKPVKKWGQQCEYHDPKLSHQQILEKAIKKAIDNGWDCFDLAEHWEWFVNWNRESGLHMSTKPKTKGVTYTSRNYPVFELIFNHDFAKALWPDPDSDEPHTVHDNTPYLEPLYYWQHHLKRMVIADDPVKYLGENIK